MTRRTPLEKVGKVNEEDLGYFLEQIKIKGREVGAGADGEPAKK